MVLEDDSGHPILPYRLRIKVAEGSGRCNLG